MDIYFLLTIVALVSPLFAVRVDDGSQPMVFLPPAVQNEEEAYIVKSALNAFSMKCGATGAPTPTIKWYKDDAEVQSSMAIESKPDGSLDIKMMVAALQGKYQCKAGNEFGTSSSNYTDLDMAYMKEFDAPPAIVRPTTVKEGDPLKLDCQYSDPFSNPTPRWGWVLQDTLTGANPVQNNLQLNGRLSVDARGNLHLQYVIPTDQHQNWFYACEAWQHVNNVKKVGSFHRIEVEPRDPIPNSPPSIVYANGPDIEEVEGGNIDMYCIFTGYPLVTIAWRKLSGPRPRFEYGNGNTKATMVDVKSTPTYEGTYECTGSQPGIAATVTRQFNVKVLQKPSFITGPYNKNVTEGGSVTFECIVKAKPPATIEWLVNGETLDKLPVKLGRIVEGNKYTFNKLTRGTGPDDSDLQVVTCKATNVNKNGAVVGVSFKDGYINVVLPLKLKTSPENYTISDNRQNVILDCEFKSDPSKAPQISWHRNGKAVIVKADKFEVAPNNSLIIMTKNFDVLKEATGDYSCVGTTSAPFQQIEAKAFVDINPDVVPLAPIAAASVSLWWVGLVIVLLILLLIFILICCLIRRNRGESYPVDEVERKMGNDPEKDLKADGFHDYQRKEKDPIGGSRASLDSSIKLDSDDDSMLEYGDIDTGKFNEDGSFIGQYGTYDRKQADSTV